MRAKARFPWLSFVWLVCSAFASATNAEWWWRAVSLFALGLSSADFRVELEKWRKATGRI